MDDIRSDLPISDLPDEDVQLLSEEVRQIKEDERQSVQKHLTQRTTLERIEAEYQYLVDANAYGGSRAEWTGVAREWIEFKATLIPGDELWDFSDVRCDGGFCSGAEGFAVVRQGQVVSWQTMAVIS
jgi:hypothetical protein